MVSDEFSDLVVSHKISKSEIDYGIFNIRERDGTKNILKNLSERFTMVIKNKEIENRKLMGHKIWIGYDIMAQFSIDQVATITRKENIIYVD